MSTPTVTSAVLAALESHEPGSSVSLEKITADVQERVADRDRIPRDNEIRGRLARLRKEGVVRRPERGRYALVRIEPSETAAASRLRETVERIVRPEALRRTVLWDATPYLQGSEDGAPGTRLVVEHEHAASLEDEVAVAFPADEQIATWTTTTTGPLGVRLWEPDGPTPYRIPFGIVFVNREKLGVTGVTPHGYRAPFAERVVVEFLGAEGPAEATPIVQNVLQDPSTDLTRLRQAAESLGAVDDLGILLAGLGDALRPELREPFLKELPPVIRTLIGGRA